MTPDELDAREAGLRLWEAELVARANRLDAQAGEATSLPAAPVSGVLLHLLEDRRVGGLDAEQLAVGLGLDPMLVRDILSGQREALAVAEVREVCEGLHASPFDLWSPEDARTILASYPPETWPRHIEPVDDLYETGAGDFVSRRVAQQADELFERARRDGLLGATSTIVVTPYEQVGVLAVDSAGRVAAVADEQAPARDGIDYFLTFAQLRRPMETDLDGPLPTVPPSGADAPPELVPIAERIRSWTPTMTMLRLSDPASGNEHWLGLDGRTSTWQTWDDPALEYPGARSEILDAGRHLDPDMLAPRAPSLTIVSDGGAPPESVGIELS